MSTDHDVAPASNYNYLQECLDRQGIVAEELFRGSQNLRGIEEKVSTIASRSLIYDHIEPIKKIEPWGGQQFWQWPSRKEFDERRGLKPIAFWDKDDNRKNEKTHR